MISDKDLFFINWLRKISKICLYVNYKKYILPSSLDIFHPLLYSMTIVDSLFGLLTETEDLEQVIRKHPLHIALMDIWEESAYEGSERG